MGRAKARVRGDLVGYGLIGLALSWAQGCGGAAAPGTVGAAPSSVETPPMSSASPSRPPRPVFTERRLPEAVTGSTVPASVMAVVGAAESGFGWWMSLRGRFLAVYVFSEPPAFGHHGEVIGSPPRLTLFDVDAGTGEVIDDLVAASPDGRWAVTRTGRSLSLLDAQTGHRRDLSEADPTPDQNPCLPPRQASFDPTSRFLTTVDRGGDLVIEHLSTGGRQALSFPDALVWRASPTATPGWVVVQLVTEDSNGDGVLGFPIQQTSCACRWCRRFARSYGFYGWAGDAFETSFAGPRRIAVAADGPATLLVGSRTVVAVRAEALNLHGEDGEVVALPAGCDEQTGIDLIPGSPYVLLGCEGGRTAVWDPSWAEPALLPGRFDWAGDLVPGSASGGTRWVGGFLTTEGETRLAHLDLDEAVLSVGPIVDGEGGQVIAGWPVGLKGEELVALDPYAGRVHRHVGLLGAEIEGAGVKSAGGGLRVLDARRGQLVDVGASTPSLTSADGCAVTAAEPGSVATGPWTVRCP